ncbi:hypothetical protein [Propionivibrio sp.]|uniref:hypothetical protein n=1 Tax=Propionivibrio sp. TaxID=2212460 RepID=UPI00272EC658|nr:hypothetical protein [Propionivibrio sp.]
MKLEAEVAARNALALAATYLAAGRDLDAQVQSDIVRELHIMLDRDEALRRRDEALREAYRMLGDETPVSVLDGALQRFAAEIWPIWKLSAQPPDHAKPFQRALFEACRWAATMPRPDGEMKLPKARQLDRVLDLS